MLIQLPLRALHYHRPPRRDLPRPTYCSHGAALWLAGSLLAWVRTSAASLAALRACSSLVSCTDMMVITAAVPWLARKIHATGLRSRCIAANWCSTFRCLQVLLLVAPWRVLGLGSWFLLVVKLVVEKALEADPSWCSGKPNAAVWLLELAGHVAMV